jgi:hypothetical protein
MVDLGSEFQKLIVAQASSGSVAPLMTADIGINTAGNLKPAKDKSTERIDGIVAAIVAIGRAMVAQEEPQPMYQVFWV